MATKLTLDSIIPFGKKHKGCVLEQVLKEDPGYILWAIENIKGYEWDTVILSRARDSQIPAFKFNVGELNSSLRFLNALEKGLDPYGEVRQLHGFKTNDDIHSQINYIKKAFSYLSEELSKHHFINIKT